MTMTLPTTMYKVKSYYDDQISAPDSSKVNKFSYNQNYNNNKE